MKDTWLRERIDANLAHTIDLMERMWDFEITVQPPYRSNAILHDEEHRPNIFAYKTVPKREFLMCIGVSDSIEESTRSLVEELMKDMNETETSIEMKLLLRGNSI